MWPKKQKSIPEICKEVDLIIENKGNKTDYEYLYLDLQGIRPEELEFIDIAVFCDKVLDMAQIKNRTIRFLEKDFWSFLISLPIKIVLTKKVTIKGDEVLEPNRDYKNQWKRMLSKILGLSTEILKLPDDKSKASELRRANALKLISGLYEFYNIPGVITLYCKSIRSKNRKEQYAALEGLENYYNLTDDQIDDELVEVLNEIIRKTDDRSVVSTCLQIQINSGKISQLSAVFIINDWKDEHRYKE